MSSGAQIPHNLQRRARRSHKKSKNGCRTCRIRKVKCDERRPLCQNCERHFIGLTVCDFDTYEHPSLTQPGEGIAARTNQLSEQRPTPAQHEQPPDSRDQHLSIQSRGRAAEPLTPLFNSYQPIASTLLDPFQTHPATVLTPAGVDILMRHYLADFIYRTFPFYTRPTLTVPWWHFLRDDELLFHAILLSSSFDRSRLIDQSKPGIAAHSEDVVPSPDTRFHNIMQHCLALLTSRAGNSSTATMDHTIVSVASLAALESGRQNFHGLRTHLRGLDQLVQLRGGLPAFREQNPLAANTVLWTILMTKDTLPSEDADQPPYSQQALLDSLHLPNHELQARDAAIAEISAAGVDDDTLAIMRTVHLLVETLTRENFAETEPYTDAALQTMTALCTVSANLLHSIARPEPRSSTPSSWWWSRSFRLAACLQILASVSGYFPDPTLRLHALVHELKTSLTPLVDTLNDVSTSGNLLLWLLAVGGVSAHAMPERAWFVGYSILAVRGLGIRDWDAFREHLMRFAPNDNFCEVSFRLLWEEMARKSEDMASILS